MDDAQPTVMTCGPVPGFAPGIGRYVAQFAETRAELLRQVAGLTAAQLSWSPNADTESIGTQLLHVAAVEWAWIFQNILGRPDADYEGWEAAFPLRVGAAQVTGEPIATFTARLAGVRAQVLDALHAMGDDDLGRLVGDAASPEDEPAAQVASIEWILFHLVHHEAHHAGQVELLRRLLPQDLS